MQLREYDYSAAQTVRKRCIHYAKDGNTVVKHWRDLYPLETVTGCKVLSGLYLQYEKEDYSELFRVYNDLGSDCVEYGYLSGWYGVTEEAVQRLKEYIPFIGLEGYKLWLAQKELKGEWINNSMIRGLADAGEVVLAGYYREYHDQQVRLRDEKTQTRQAELEQRQREEEQKRQEELKALVFAAEKCILERQEVINAPCDGKTIILYLMKKYGIVPPLRTQGWINEKLVKVTVHDDSINFTFQKTKKCKASESVADYLFQLRDKIDMAYTSETAEGGAA